MGTSTVSDGDGGGVSFFLGVGVSVTVGVIEGSRVGVGVEGYL